MAARERRENSRVGLVDANVPQLVEGRRLKEFFECIPRSSGVFKSIKVTLTCIDAGDEFLVVGSDAGQVFVYERERKRSGVLAEEGRSNSVSCVKLSESESEHRSRVAFGCKSGFVFIFQIQRRQEEYRDHPLRTFRLDRDHTAPVTCMTWHKDGQILISGDKMGKIFISSVDMAKNTCSIQLLHKAGSSVVQLSAGVTEEWIVMSDLERSFLLSLDPDSKRCIPVGQRDRKSGPFGACLIMSDREMVYVSRPGLRIWKADFCGKVDIVAVC
jgi:WD40 repeat protein